MKKILLACAAIGLLFASCNKAEIVPPPIPTSNASQIFEDNLEDAKQSFSFSNATGGFFEGENGVTISVPGNAFVYADGTPVPGNVDFELIEALDYNTMVALNKGTTADNQILVSGGQIKLTATKAGSEVLLAEGSAVSVFIPSEDPDPNMRLYEGLEDETGFVNWALIEEDSVVIESDSSEWESGYFFDFDNDKLGWINCDYLWPSAAEQTTITAVLPEEFTYEYAYAYAVFPGINSVYTLYPTDFELASYSGINVPIGTETKFVIVAEIDDVYYSAFSDVVSVTLLHEEVMTPTPSTLEEIEAAIADL